MLHIEWSTILFEAVNFLVLLVVLTRFFYRPVLRVMRTRQEAIAARLRAADEQTREAVAERERLVRLTQDAAAQAEATLSSARVEATAIRERALASAREEAAALAEAAKRRLAEQEQAAFAGIEDSVRAAAVSIAARLIHQSAGTAVHRTLLDQFIGTRGAETEAETATLRRVLARDNAPITIELAYPPQADTEERLREWVGRASGVAGSDRRVSFRVDPSLVAGARVAAGEALIDFSLAHALQELAAGGNHAEEPRP